MTTHNLMNTPDVLKKIMQYKRDEVEVLKRETTLSLLRKQAKDLAPARGFKRAIERVKATQPALICEVKKASPSKGIIRADFNPVEITQAYEKGGAACLSVLTDGPGFQGSDVIFKTVRQTTELPLLRKDFMLEPIQIAHSAAMGADCVLIIMAMLDDKMAQALVSEAHALGLDALIETHNLSELERALKLGSTLIGINNRDLHTFKTSLDIFAPLAAKVPDGTTLIAESGIFTRKDINRLTQDGADGFLIGESFMRQNDVCAAVKALI